MKNSVVTQSDVDFITSFVTKHPAFANAALLAATNQLIDHLDEMQDLELESTLSLEEMVETAHKFFGASYHYYGVTRCGFHPEQVPEDLQDYMTVDQYEKIKMSDEGSSF